MNTPTNDIISRFDNISSRVKAALARAGRGAQDATLVAVSKKHPAESVALLARHWLGQGLPIFGESYVQEALEKIPAVQELLNADLTQGELANPQSVKPHWHFIGGIQSRKAKSLIGLFDLIHSLDSLKVASNLQKSWEENILGKPRKKDETPPEPQAVLIQVNIGREPQKSGVMPDKLLELMEQCQIFSGLRIDGLMCLPPFFGSSEDSRPFFQELRQLRDMARQQTGLPLPHLSMGMSMDFEAAIEEGATFVRIGTDIFGERL